MDAATRVSFHFLLVQRSSIAFAYDDDHGTTFAMAGGMGVGQLYMASSLSLSRPKFDLKTAYIESSTQFRRTNVAVPLTSEPDRDNTLFTLRPTKWSSFSVGTSKLFKSCLSVRA